MLFKEANSFMWNDKRKPTRYSIVKEKEKLNCNKIKSQTVKCFLLKYQQDEN